jgi:REP element-mobilizing transposase RayT
MNRRFYQSSYQAHCYRNGDDGFGGRLLEGRRKSKRPLHLKRPHHLVLKAADPWRLLVRRKQVEEILRKYSEKFGVALIEFAIHADHIHIAARFGNRPIYTKWIRAVTAVLAMKIHGLTWRLRPWSRLVDPGRGLWRVLRYLQKNRREGEFLLMAHRRAETWLRVELHARGAPPTTAFPDILN